jgi:nucleoid-associated protein YgaU
MVYIMYFLGGAGIHGFTFVLLVVLIVAMVVKSRNKPNPQTAIHNNTSVAPDRSDNTDNAGTPGDTTAGGTSSTDTQSGTAPPPATPGPSATEPAKRDPFVDSDQPNKTPDWDTVIKYGPAVLSAPTGVTTTTPPVGHDGASFSPDSGGTTRRHPLTPGSLGTGATLDTGGTGATTPPRTTPPAAGNSHTRTIGQGDTFSTIAREAYGNKKYYYVLEKANPGVDPTRLRPGQKINVPEMPASARTDHSARSGAAGATGAAGGNGGRGDTRDSYVVKQGDSLYRISMRLYGNANKVDALYNANKDRIGPDRERLKLGMALRLPDPPTSNSR